MPYALLYDKLKALSAPKNPYFMGIAALYYEKQE